MLVTITSDQFSKHNVPFQAGRTVGGGVYGGGGTPGGVYGGGVYGGVVGGGGGGSAATQEAWFNSASLSFEHGCDRDGPSSENGRVHSRKQCESARREAGRGREEGTLGLTTHCRPWGLNMLAPAHAWHLPQAVSRVRPWNTRLSLR